MTLMPKNAGKVDETLAAIRHRDPRLQAHPSCT